MSFTDFKEEGRGLAVVCEWNEKQFGRCEDSSKDIDNHWFVLEVLEDDDDINHPEDRVNFYSAHCQSPVSLQVVDYFTLPGMEMVAVWKTFWLKLIQRKWKKVFEERQRIKSNRMSTSALIYRERNGGWPSDLKYLPGLRGMLATA